MMMTMIIHSREKETDDTVVGSFHSHSREVSVAVDLAEEAVEAEVLAVSVEAEVLEAAVLLVDGKLKIEYIIKPRFFVWVFCYF